MTPQTVTIPQETLQKFTELSNLLFQAGKVAREITETTQSAYILEGKQMTDSFWRETEELRKAFAHLAPEKIDSLINEAVSAVRKNNADS